MSPNQDSSPAMRAGKQRSRGHMGRRSHIGRVGRPSLLGPQAGQQGQGDVGLQPGALRSLHERGCLLQRECLRGPPSPLPFGRLDQRGDVASYQVVALGVADRPDQDVV